MNIIPIQYYTSIFFQFLLIMTLFVFITGSQKIEEPSNLTSKRAFGFFLFIFVLLYMGLRPVNYRFGDMVIYDMQFQNFANGAIPKYEKDVLFELFLNFFAKVSSSSVFFFFCTCVYVIPLYFATKKILNDYWFYGFFMLIISFSFWAYGTNGIRNGMATSLFLFGLSRSKQHAIIAIMIASTFLHKSMLLPTVAYILTLFYNKPKYYLLFWFSTIPLSLALGGFFTGFFMGLGIVDEKALVGYLGEFDQLKEGVELKIGFRWDFLLYSASGVFAGWYFIFKRKFEDLFYTNLFNVYLVVNGFWVLIIRANFSNRFAYLSWFMLGIIIIYPLLKNKFFENQHQVVVRIILLYFAFTYLMNVILIS